MLEFMIKKWMYSPTQIVPFSDISIRMNLFLKIKLINWKKMLSWYRGFNHVSEHAPPSQSSVITMYNGIYKPFGKIRALFVLISQIKAERASLI